MGLDVSGIITLMLTVIGVGGTIGGLTFAAIRKLSAEMKEFRAELGGVRDELRGEITGVRDKLDREVAGLRTEIISVRTELRGEIAGVRTELRAVEGRLGRRIDAVREELVETRVAVTDRVARLEDKVFGVPLPDAAADTA